jgi:hypothetical protein
VKSVVVYSVVMIFLPEVLMVKAQVPIPPLDVLVVILV